MTIEEIEQELISIDRIQKNSEPGDEAAEENLDRLQGLLFKYISIQELIFIGQHLPHEMTFRD
jgi:hypothetical protein